MDYQHMNDESTSSEGPSISSGTPSPPRPADSKQQEEDISLSSESQTTAPAVVTETSPSAVTVTGVKTSASLKKPPVTSQNGYSHQDSVGGGGGDKSLVSNVMTSSQAIKRRSNSYDQVKSDEDRSTAIKEFECPAGDRYVHHETKLERIRANLKWFIEHIAFRAITLILILVDLTIVVIALAIAPPSFSGHETLATPEEIENQQILHDLDIVALTFSCYFMVEVGLRIFAQGPKLFFRQILEIIDAVVVLVSFIVVVVDISLEKTGGADYIKLVNIGRLVRAVRFFMLIRVVVTQRQHIAKASRLMVSENKRRYQKDGFDLDLCYITDRVLAMSFPSEGFMSIYRNPIEEVSRFFNTKYPNKYRIYNCCSERTYDADKYFNSSMVRLMIDDHNVPSLRSMVNFVRDVEEWMNLDRGNVVAIHCKGGKGRTGTMICTWLLHCAAFTSADDALDYFASRRTDLSVGSKFQGVETPSQSRYVNYFEKMLTQHAGKVPDEVPIKPIKISVSGLKGIGTGDGRDLIVKFLVAGELIYEARFGTDTNCTTIFERETSTITATLINSPVLAGDVKVRFEATSNIPCDYDDCPWFFWFNTSFIDNNELVLGREDLDNPHKEKTWKLYKPHFRVTLGFEAASL